MKTNKQSFRIHAKRGVVGILLTTLFLFGLGNWKNATASTANPPPQTKSVSGTTITVQPAGQVSWDEMLAYEAAHKNDLANASAAIPFNPSPKPHEITLPEQNVLPQIAPRHRTDQPLTPSSVQAGGSLIANFAALGDNNTAIPPDTMGAAGPNHLMVMLNSQVRIQSKSGATTSTVSLSTFWTNGTGLSGTPFDPHVVFDSLTNRWIATVDANPRASSSQVWFAISANSDPTGTWYYYSFAADSTGTYWADYPGLGVNNSYIAITNNMYTISTPNTFSGVKMWVIDKSTLPPGGSLSVTVFPMGFDTYSGYNGFTLKPAVTFDASESNLYIVDNGWTTGGGTPAHRVSKVTTSGGSPVWSQVGFYNVSNSYDHNMIKAAQKGTTTRIETNDIRIMNAVVRNGHLWTTHMGGLPVGSVDRTAVFWYEVNPTTPSLVQSGVLNGGVDVHYIFPSITVNKNNDAVVGFTRTDATRYAEAVFVSRLSTDTTGTMSSITVIKQGLASYVKTGTGTKVRWGDYSATVVDPSDDLTIWTIQEYAAADAGPNPGDDRWGTWWGKIQFSTGSADLAITKSATGLQSRSFVYNLTATNNGPNSATNVTVSDNLPTNQLTYVSNDCGAPPPVNAIWTWNIGNLAIGGSTSCNITVTLHTNTTGWVQNMVQISGSEADTNSWNNNANYAFSVPDAQDDYSYSCPKNGQINVPIPGVLMNDTDLDGDSLRAILKDDVSHGTLTLNSDGSFVYTPDTDFEGNDSFTYYAYDGLVTSNLATVWVAVGNAPPNFFVYLPLVKR